MPRRVTTRRPVRRSIVAVTPSIASIDDITDAIDVVAGSIAMSWPLTVNVPAWTHAYSAIVPSVASSAATCYSPAVLDSVPLSFTAATKPDVSFATVMSSAESVVFVSVDASACLRRRRR